MNKTLPTVLFLLFFINCLQAQVGGDNVYEFLNLSPSARITALGGTLITVKDDDIALAYGNPAVLNSSMHQQLSFNYNFHLADISNGYAAYGHHVKSWDMTFHGGIQYINYGTFDATDEFGQINGTFDAAEYAITLGAAHQLYEKLSLGANLKFISSQLESYKSVGVTMDLGAFYRDTSGRFSASLVVRNAGTQLTTYRDGNREDLPLDVQFGVSQKLKHLPFRLSVTYHNLNRWNILYDDPNQEEETILLGESEEAKERSRAAIQVDNFFRHLIFSGEFLFGKKENFRMRVGYNHFQRKELSVDNFRSLSGFSFGVGLKISKFRIDYGRGVYHLGGSLNHISISTNFKEFRK